VSLAGDGRRAPFAWGADNERGGWERARFPKAHASPAVSRKAYGGAPQKFNRLYPGIHQQFLKGFLKVFSQASSPFEAAASVLPDPCREAYRPAGKRIVPTE